MVDGPSGEKGNSCSHSCARRLEGADKQESSSSRGSPAGRSKRLSALASSSVTRAIVSTDSRAVANAAIEYGAEVPFMRPAELAADGTRDFPVFRHALDWLWENERYKPEIVVQVRPTTPLRPRNLIDDAVAILRGDPAVDSVRSVAVASRRPQDVETGSGRIFAASPPKQVGRTLQYAPPGASQSLLAADSDEAARV
jgi:hypothetical protein